MKVICKGHNTCKYRNACYHSTEHEQSVGEPHKDGMCVIGNSSDCHCNETYLRAIKLKKIQGENKY